jgi:MoCo/4Fe-4S cofactor protein with predicted Tat translocation signal
MNDFWRSLEDYADREEFRAMLRRAYPDEPEIPLDSLSRRRFLQLMGASLALSGLNGCWRPPNEVIVPYVRQPEEIVPGRPLYFATAMPIAGVGTGLLVESHMGRPTKVEGNPLHPGSLGATDAFAQASVLDLWDPARAKTVIYRGRIRPWSTFVAALHSALENDKKTAAGGLHILTGTISSPTLAEQLRNLLKQYPGSKWHQYEAAGKHHGRAGALGAFGNYVETQYRLPEADVILAFGAELLSCSPGHVRYAHDFADRRRITAGGKSINRLYAIESTPSSAGALADHRLALAPSEMESFARAVAARLGIGGAGSNTPLSAYQVRWLDVLVADLQRHRGSSLVLVSEGQPAAIHILGHLLNDALGNVGRTIVYTNPIEAAPVDEIASIRELAQDLERGSVSILIIVEGDPAYNAPADLDFASKLGKVSLSAHLNLDFNQTSALCQWHIPAAHYLESWSDVRAYDGTATIMQPLIAPLYDGKTAHELLAVLNRQPEQTPHDIVRAYWHKQTGKNETDFERWWRKSLHDGIVEGSAFHEIKNVKLKIKNLNAAGSASSVESPVNPESSPDSDNRQSKIENQKSNAPSPPPSPASGRGSGDVPIGDGRVRELEILFRPDPSLFDGRFANNGWLQELPKPLTKLTWDNAAYLSPATARDLGLANDERYRGGNVKADIIEISFNGRSLRAPVCIVPGQADNTVELQLGYGRARVGPVGSGVGYDAYHLRTTDALWSGRAATIRKTGARYDLAETQTHHAIEGRNAVRVATLDEFKNRPDFAKAHEEQASLYPEYEYKGYKWGMSIDLNACIGCNACVIACQAENNIPVVGKEQVLRSREMHWLRIDTYFTGPPENPETYLQPMLCMHCEKAPCEVVCPVAATSHSAEGLNDMVYNRCVGTRYCSNNCPYKVRRFNFFQYSDWQSQSLKGLRNPDVTVRSRGVMEKCTYCVQRINHARIAAEEAGRRVRDGEIVTACQQACPAQAIVFGDINDKDSKVSKLKTEQRNYSVLEELNTQPRTTYLAAVRNPNPELTKK